MDLLRESVGFFKAICDRIRQPKVGLLDSELQTKPPEAVAPISTFSPQPRYRRPRSCRRLSNMDSPRNTLPSLPAPLHKMTLGELQKFLALLISKSCGVDKIQYRIEKAKPKWWPQDLAWANPMIVPKATRSVDPRDMSKKFLELLRTAVKNCYVFHNAEHLLKPSLSAVQGKTTISKELNNVEKSKSTERGAHVAGMPPSPVEVPQPFMELYICFFCDIEFKKKSELQQHQLECQKNATSSSNNKDAMKVFQAAKTNEHQIRNQCKTLASINEDVFPAEDDIYPKTISKTRFIEYFGLIPLAKAEKLLKQQRKEKNVPLDCEVIEILDDDEVCIKSPPTPHTPKSLISQLSRDLSPPGRRRLLEQDILLEKDTDEESESSHASQPRKISAVLTIDYCSPLGSRVSKYMEQSASEQHQGARDDDSDDEKKHYESYCSTPKKSKEDGMLQKLRNRPNQFPIMFKKSKKHCPKICHMYKFTARARREWFKTKEAGMNKRARKLRRAYFRDKCSVTLDKLDPEFIKRWTSRKSKPVQYVPMKNYQWNSFYQEMNHLYQSQNNALVSNDAVRRMMGMNPVRDIQANLPNNTIIVTDTGAVVYKTPSPTVHNGVGASSPHLTPPSSPEQPRPMPNLLIPNTANLSPSQHNAMLAALMRSHWQPSYSKPQVAKRTGAVSFTRPLGQSDISNVQFQPVQQTEPIYIDLSDDDVVSISSTDSNGSGSGKRKRNSENMPQVASGPKRARVEPGARTPPQASQPMLLFKCHLCHAEITCRDNFAAQIQLHFRQQHAVTNINLIEHVDPSGQKVVSIVEESPLSKSPASNRPMPASAKKNLFRPNQPTDPAGAKRRSSRHSDDKASSPVEVICLD